MNFRIHEIIEFGEYEVKNKELFHKLNELVRQQYKGKDLSRKKPRHPAEQRLLERYQAYLDHAKHTGH